MSSSSDFTLCCAGSACKWSLLLVPVRLGPSRSYLKSELVVWKDAEELIAGGGMPIGVIGEVGEGWRWRAGLSCFWAYWSGVRLWWGWRGFICRAGHYIWLKKMQQVELLRWEIKTWQPLPNWNWQEHVGNRQDWKWIKTITKTKEKPPLNPVKHKLTYNNHPRRRRNRLSKNLVKNELTI